MTIEFSKDDALICCDRGAANRHSINLDRAPFVQLCCTCSNLHDDTIGEAI